MYVAVAGAAAVDREEADAVGRDRDDLAVLDQLDAARLAQERGDRGGEEHLALADADDERALEARADEHVGMVAVDDDEGEVALELGVGRAHGLGEVALVVALDEVRDDLGVGLGARTRGRRRASESRSSRKFSTMPLRTTATSSSTQPVSGWAFS